MRILVTGASGFIGRHLVSRLSDAHELFAVDRDPQRAAQSETARVVLMDLARTLNVSALPAEIDIIIHLVQANVPFPEAANELWAVNTSTTQQLLEYGQRARARQFVLASTGDVYGRRIGLCKETDTAAPVSYYGLTKAVAEMLVQTYSDYLRPCIVRLFQPYGPGQSDRLIPKLADRIRQGQVVRLNKDDRPRMTPVYVDDVTRAVESAIDSSYSGTVNIAGDRVVSVRELAEEIGRALGCKPFFEESGQESADMAGDNSLMRQVLGDWSMVALHDGLSRTFKGEGAIG
jgi:nucleoside-diphosphate-sugar epimerase